MYRRTPEAKRLFKNQLKSRPDGVPYPFEVDGPIYLIDDTFHSWVRFKYVIDGLACFEQFGRTELLVRPVKQFGKVWTIRKE